MKRELREKLKIQLGRAGPIAVFVASFALSAWALPHLPLRPGEYPRSQTIPELMEPGSDTFFATTTGHDLSHIVLYHDIGESIANARSADILIVGNSRAQLGWHEEVLQVEAERLGLKIFNLAVGHGDAARFALELIRKHDLRPRILICSGGPFMFNDRLSEWAREVVEMSPWEARKIAWERQAAWKLGTFVHAYLPRLDYFDQPLTSWWVHYRSENTGWWRNLLEPDYRYPVGFIDERADYAYTLPLASQLKQEMDRRGTLLVLTMVPYGNTQSGHLPFLASTLGVPSILPDFTGMETADGSHLHRESATRISREFWERFIQQEPVREKLGLADLLKSLQDRRHGFARVSVARMPPSSPQGSVHGVPRKSMSPIHRSDRISRLKRRRNHILIGPQVYPYVTYLDPTAHGVLADRQSLAARSLHTHRAFAPGGRCREADLGECPMGIPTDSRHAIRPHPQSVEERHVSLAERRRYEMRPDRSELARCPVVSRIDERNTFRAHQEPGDAGSLCAHRA